MFFFFANIENDLSFFFMLRANFFVVFLFLLSRKNPFKFQYLYLSDEKRLRKSNFNFNYPLAIYLHGLSESATGEKQSSQEVKDGKLLI